MRRACSASALVSANRGGFDVATEIEIGIDLTSDEERGVYRLVQEALTNVAKHARAKHAEVRVRATDGAVEIKVADDGAGFDPSAGPGRGLLGMRERVELLGGTIEFDSSPGNGTRIASTLPLRAG